MYTLTFDYSFSHDNECVFFALSLPYTHGHLRRFLKWVCALGNLENSKGSDMMDGSSSSLGKTSSVTRELLCSTAAGLPCDMIVVREQRLTTLANDLSGEEDSDLLLEEKDELPGGIEGDRATTSLLDARCRKAVVLFARQNAAETASSWVMQGFLRFLLGSSERAKRLRKRYDWYVVPMMNVDGVVAGWSRCSFDSGNADVSKSWADAAPDPIVQALRNKLAHLQKTGTQVVACLDLGGNNTKKDVFLYMTPSVVSGAAGSRSRAAGAVAGGGGRGGIARNSVWEGAVSAEQVSSGEGGARSSATGEGTALPQQPGEKSEAGMVPSNNPLVSDAVEEGAASDSVAPVPASMPAPPQDSNEDEGWDEDEEQQVRKHVAKRPDVRIACLPDVFGRAVADFDLDKCIAHAPLDLTADRMSPVFRRLYAGLTPLTTFQRKLFEGTARAVLSESLVNACVFTLETSIFGATSIQAKQEVYRKKSRPYARVYGRPPVLDWVVCTRETSKFYGRGTPYCPIRFASLGLCLGLSIFKLLVMEDVKNARRHELDDQDARNIRPWTPRTEEQRRWEVGFM